MFKCKTFVPTKTQKINSFEIAIQKLLIFISLLEYN